MLEYFRKFPLFNLIILLLIVFNVVLACFSFMHTIRRPLRICWHYVCWPLLILFFSFNCAQTADGKYKLMHIHTKSFGRFITWLLFAHFIFPINKPANANRMCGIIGIGCKPEEIDRIIVRWKWNGKIFCTWHISSVSAVPVRTSVTLPHCHSAQFCTNFGIVNFEVAFDMRNRHCRPNGCACWGHVETFTPIEQSGVCVCVRALQAYLKVPKWSCFNRFLCFLCSEANQLAKEAALEH